MKASRSSRAAKAPLVGTAGPTPGSVREAQAPAQVDRSAVRTPDCEPRVRPLHEQGIYQAPPLRAGRCAGRCAFHIPAPRLMGPTFGSTWNMQREPWR